MKNYVLFAGSSYYPSGGFRDFIESFDTEEEAKDYYSEQNIFEYGFKKWDWGHILDLEDSSYESL